MSKPSPYNRNQGYKRDPSPLSTYLENTPSRATRHQKHSQPLHNVYTKYINRPEDSSSTYANYKPTQKKRVEPQGYDIENIIEKTRQLQSQNIQLYGMLQQRGRIITALEKKLQDQMYREVKTLEQIQQQKNKFISDSHRKFREYEQRIEELIQQIYELNEQKYQEKLIKAKEIDLIKDSFNQEHSMKMYELNRQQQTYRQSQQEYQQNQINALLELKNKEIEEITYEYQKCIEQLKSEIDELNRQLLQFNHTKTLELSEQKLMYDHMLENITKEHCKERQFLSVEHELLVKKLEQLLASKEIEANKLGQLVKVGEIQKSTRQQELMEKKSKLQEEIREIEAFYKDKTFHQNRRLKELNYSEIQALEKGTSAMHSNLREEISNLIALNSAKTEEINKLHAQIQTQRLESKNNIKKLQENIEYQKNKLKELERTHMLEIENMKIKWAELSQADLSALKKYYEGQVEVLQQQVLQKDKEAAYNRSKLHEELQQKNQMRKRFDLTKLNLEKRITELQLFIKQDLLKKNQDVVNVNAAMNLTSSKLLREAADKEKIKQSNEAEKKKLQELIVSKDVEIEELNNKIKMMRQNYTKEISQKNAELQIVKKHHSDIEVELKKEKSFFDGELKKKESILRNTKENYEREIAIIKQKFKEEYDSVVKEMTSKIQNLQVEINRLRTVEKTLKHDITILEQNQRTEIGDKSEQLHHQKERLEREKVTMEEKLKKYYNEEISKLNQEIADLKKQLAYKEQDIRAMENKIYQLQKKNQQTLESHQQLKKLEDNILNIGLDNSAIGNLVGLVNPPRDESS